MQRPDVRVVDNQQVTVTSVDISQSEAEELLIKYGFRPQGTQQVPAAHTNPMTFEEMVRQQEDDERRQQEDRYRKVYGPKAMTFDNNRISYSETKYSDIDLDGGNTFGIKVQIVTDMKI